MSRAGHRRGGPQNPGTPVSTPAKRLL